MRSLLSFRIHPNMKRLRLLLIFAAWLCSAQGDEDQSWTNRVASVGTGYSSRRASKVMLDLAKSLTSSLTTQLEDQARRIEDIQLSNVDIRETMKTLQGDGNQCSSHIQSSESKFATLAHRVFQLEERASLDEVLYVFNTMVCNASIAVLRSEIQAMKWKDQSQSTKDVIVSEDDPMDVMDTILGETNAILGESQAKVTNLEAQLQHIKSEMSRMREDFVEALSNLNKRLSDPIDTPQDDASLVPDINDKQHPTEEILQRQEALETRMNALENLIFNQALEVTEEAPQKGATSEENDEPAELAERAERGLKEYDEVIAEVPVPTEENKFQHLDLSGLSQKLLNLGDRMKSLKDSIGVMNLPQGEATPLRPSPSPRCRAQDSARDMPGLDDWCRDNCSTGNCPNNLCVCDH